MDALDDNQAARTRIPAPFITLGRTLLRRLAISGRVSYGDSLRVGRGAVIGAVHSLEIGSYVSVGPRSIIQVEGRIDDYVMIGMGVQIVGRDDHAIRQVGMPMIYSTWIGDRRPTARDTIHIERDVWVGAASVLLSGIKVGEGSVIAAGSVVTKTVDPFTVVAGNPAKIVGRRFSTPEEEREHSLALDRRARESSPRSAGE